VSYSWEGEFLDGDDWTFDDGWTGSWAAGWTHTLGYSSVLTHVHAAVVGTTYTISYTVTGRTNGTFAIRLGGQTTGTKWETGTHSLTATTNEGLEIVVTVDFDGTIVVAVEKTLVLTMSAA
jgi:hypothetical protein